MSKKKLEDFINCKFEDLPNNPPTSFEDLSYFQQRPEQIADITNDTLSTPSGLRFWADVVEVASKHPGLEVRDCAIFIKNTPEVIEKKIVSAADNYDSGRSYYFQILTGKSPADWPTRANEYADQEGLPSIPHGWIHPDRNGDTA